MEMEVWVLYVVRQPRPTTRNRDFAECKILCRVSKIGYSAKTFFAECCTQRVLCRVPGTRQQNALGKGLLCRVPDSRQKRGTRQRMTRVTVFRHALLCRVPAVRHSAKILFYFLKISLPSVPGTRQRFIYFFKKFLCRVSQIWHSAKI